MNCVFYILLQYLIYTVFPMVRFPFAPKSALLEKTLYFQTFKNYSKVALELLWYTKMPFDIVQLIINLPPLYPLSLQAGSQKS